MKNRIAWSAGIIDGEGCICIHKSQPGAPSQPRQKSVVYHLDLAVKMTYKPAIELLLNIFQVGTITRQKPGKNNKRVTWTWVVTGKSVSIVLKKLLPYLVVKKDEALLALDFVEKNVNTLIKKQGVLTKTSIFRENAYQKMRLLKLKEWK